jgi:hypothetical protein
MPERNRLSDLVNSSIDSKLKKVHTTAIAKITAVGENTIDCQLTYSKIVNGEPIEPPNLIQVPVVFMKGGQSYTAHPVAVGDYCLVIFNERCIDGWWSGSDNVVPPDFRIHDYSDGFAIVGINPLAAAISIPEVITQIGDTYFEGNHEHIGDLERTGNTTLTGNTDQEGTYTLNGPINQTGDHTLSGKNDAGSYSVGGTSGASGSFISKDDKAVTVVNGIITDIA